jgi:hypothetical protein
MALALNGFQVLRRVGKHPDVFVQVAAEATKAARTLLNKQMKAKASDLVTVREVRKALGDELFGLYVDGMTDAEVKSVLTRLDKNHPDLKKSNADWRRNHLRDLAGGKIDPSAKAAPAKKAKASAKSARGKGAAEEPERLHSEAMGAVRRRD